MPKPTSAPPAKPKNWQRINSTKMDRLGGGAGSRAKTCKACKTTHRKRRCPWCEAQGAGRGA